MGKSANLYIIGFMGTGKTSAGQLVAQWMGLEFVDMDTLIVEREKRSIPEIFRDSGEPYFREVEKGIVAEMAKKTGLAVSCGGGTFVDPVNIDLMKKTGIVVCLTSRPETILERTRRYTQRPLLRVADPLARIKELLEARRPSYAQAHLTIDADRLTVEGTAQAIVEAVKNHG
ncbi:MAG: shikimate kinase [Deltaproteobacteria bacterium]